MVVLTILSFAPTIERLVDDEKSYTVTSVQESLGRRIMGSAYGIVTGILHQSHFPYLSLVEGSRSQYAIVVMNTTAVEQHWLAVEQESLFGRIFDGAYSKSLSHGVSGGKAHLGGI